MTSLPSSNHSAAILAARPGSPGNNTYGATSPGKQRVALN
jgi:hypothetical protein